MSWEIKTTWGEYKASEDCSFTYYYTDPVSPDGEGWEPMQTGFASPGTHKTEETLSSYFRGRPDTCLPRRTEKHPVRWVLWKRCKQIRSSENGLKND